MTYTLSIYRGGIGNPNEILYSTTFEDSKDFGPATWRCISHTLEQLAFDRTPYTRLLGPFDDGSYHVDFGSYSHFIKVEKAEI